ncbi:TPA: hypothetical protein DEO28_02905 [Candidatus Dependentiae bacterium]|nr:MAG: hypothetical protein UR14_C0005G0068 [candidate division TM6 bacterium GW2011_GWE2_31_21]KKP53144.1 MAG: hypothetical protein UR43_C0007G0068 [candidate division TM6 bacterium GW2011_GWF2_33_332]HBS47963.1 hypothetical protein [Candidatus Dependentiae bacterium]HBZ73433.1 hypothetical protein [Candidatus Dependentiae bacterium]
MNKALYMSLIAATLVLAPSCGNKKEEVKQEETTQVAEQKPVALSEVLKADALYKVVPAVNFNKENADDSVKLLEMDKEFIHAAKGTQVENVLKKFFNGQKDIVILELDEKLLTEKGLTAKMEQNKEGGEVFPHLVGEKKMIPAAAVLSVVSVEEQPEGSWMAKK